MDKKIFIEMVIPQHANLIGIARSYTDNDEDAQDIVQEVFAKLWMIRDELDKYDNLAALSIRITKNLCLNLFKHNKIKFSIFKRIDSGTMVQAPDSNIEENDTGYLLNIVSKLPELQQAVLRMKYIDELETEDIARILNCSREAVWMNLSRARKKARELFIEKNSK
jgi:RNA polymerase sigma-70 factor (ECF subfamily)